MEFGFGEEFNAWSMSVMCERKRSGSDNISLFVGIDFWGVAKGSQWAGSGRPGPFLLGPWAQWAGHNGQLTS